MAWCNCGSFSVGEFLQYFLPFSSRLMHRQTYSLVPSRLTHWVRRYIQPHSPQTSRSDRANLLVLAVFSAATAGDANGMSVSFIEESQLDALRQTMWDMNEITYSTHTEEFEVPVEPAPDEDGAETPEDEEEEPQTRTVTRTVLVISLEHKTPEEMRQEYRMTSRQEEYVCFNYPYLASQQ